MAIQDEMFKLIDQEIDLIVELGKEKIIVDNKKAKSVAKMLTDLSTSGSDAEALTNQYISQIKNICNS
ncbi:MAG: hypothetical protein LIP06_06535 [Tannerellaceae bacterium]|nr:hypothetical protein [Tannerellaceae bacterium]